MIRLFDSLLGALTTCAIVVISILRFGCYEACIGIIVKNGIDLFKNYNVDSNQIYYPK